LKKQVISALKLLKDRQGQFGDYALYEWDYTHSSAFVTCHVANAVGLCKEKGYPIPLGFWTSKLEEHLNKLYAHDSDVNRNWPAEKKISIGAYALVTMTTQSY
jgi:hypothetical protein